MSQTLTRSPPAAQALGVQAPNSFGSALGVANTALANEREQMAPVAGQMQQQFGADRQAVQQAQARVQPFNPQPAPQEPPPESPFKQFASWSTAFALLASAYTHTPMINAMNAMAAGITARRNGRIAAYQSAYQAWKDNTELALERHKEQQDDLNSALNLMSTDVSAGSAQLKAIGAQYGDQITASLAEAGDFTKLAEVAATRADTAAKLQLGYENMQLHAQEDNKPQVFVGANGNPLLYRPLDGTFTDMYGKPVIPTGVSKPGTAQPTPPPGAGLSPVAVATLGEAWAKGQPLQNFGWGTMGSQEKTQVINSGINYLIAQGKDPTAALLTSSQDYKSDQAALTQITKMATAASSYENTMFKNMDVAQNLMPKGIPTNLGPAINKWVQTGEIQSGDPNVQAYAAALTTVLDEYGKVLVGGTGSVAALSDGARQQVAGILTSASPQLTADAVFGVMRKDTQNRIQEYGNSISAINNAIAQGSSADGQSVPNASAGPTSLPIPSAFQGQPDGTTLWKGSDEYKIQGGQLVLVPPGDR